MVVIKQLQSFYTNEQLDLWLNFLAIPEVKGSPTLSNLNKIFKASICKIPFENTEMHYTESGDMQTSAEKVYKRVVVDRLGGSFCFGQNTLLLGMLRALGYRAYGCLGRLNTSHDETKVDLGISAHMVVLAQLPEDTGDVPNTYIVDWGYGLGLVRPLLLKDGEQIGGPAPPILHRVVRVSDPESSLNLSDPSSATLAEEWAVQDNQLFGGTILPQGQWRTLFHFTLHERHDKDFEMLSFLTTRNPLGFLWKTVLAIYYFPLDESEDLGMRVLVGGKVTERTRGIVKELRVVKTEEERIEALNEYFGILYASDAAAYIGRTEGAL